jgi:hypothetical protein
MAHHQASQMNTIRATLRRKSLTRLTAPSLFFSQARDRYYYIAKL